MPRIQPVDIQTAEGNTKETLKSVQRKLGAVPNIIATMAQSNAVANAYLSFSQSLTEGVLEPRLREQIALVVGETNSCNYCVAAHTTLGKLAGLENAEAISARQALSSNNKEQVALQFAQSVVRSRGHVDDAEFQNLLAAGYDEEEICEIIANVSLNMFTNYFNHIAQTEVDFDLPPALENQPCIAD